MPESLMARVLNGKYFLSKEFLEVNVSPTASYTWKSILGARDVIAKGVCRVIGNGRSTNIWRDPWVPALPLSRIQNRGAELNAGSPQQVQEIISNGQWNLDQIECVLNPWEVQSIKRIPLPIHNLDDSWMWKYDKKGRFSVRSAYFIELREKRAIVPTTSKCGREGKWRRLWDASIPPKVKIFGWKAIHSGLPVMKNLVRRGIKSEDKCPRCGTEEESIIHMVLRCDEAKRVWYMSPLRVDVDKVASQHFGDWVEDLTKRNLAEDWWNMF